MNETFNKETKIEINLLPLESIRDVKYSNTNEIKNFSTIKKNKNELKISKYENLKSHDNSNFDFKTKSEFFESKQDHDQDLDKQDDIILNKLNRNNSDLNFEKQEDYITENSPRFSESDREFSEKIFIRIKKPSKKFKSKKFSYKKCPNITTVKVDELIFSYITNPVNKDDLYFIKLSDDFFLFEIEDFNEYNRNILKYTKIPYHYLRKFTNELNKPLESVNNKIKKYQLIKSLKFIIKLLVSIIFFCILMFSFFDYGCQFFKISQTTNYYIILTFSLIGILLIINMVLNFAVYDKDVKYFTNKILLSKQDEIDSIVYKWNADYFISKLDYIAQVPKTFRYIMIILKPNKKIKIEDHVL